MPFVHYIEVKATGQAPAPCVFCFLFFSVYYVFLSNIYLFFRPVLNLPPLKPFVHHIDVKPTGPALAPAPAPVASFTPALAPAPAPTFTPISSHPSVTSQNSPPFFKVTFMCSGLVMNRISGHFLCPVSGRIHDLVTGGRNSQ